MDIYTRAYLGAKAADALAMPVHWYYYTAALDREYATPSVTVLSLCNLIAVDAA